MKAYNRDMKSYNEYELRFLQVLIGKERYDLIEHMQTVQGMKRKKVFILGLGMVFEDENERS